MEKLYEGMGIAGTVIGALGGWKFIEWMVNRKANRRRAIAEAVGAETDAFMKRYNALEEEIQRLNKKVDDLYARLHAVETDNLALLRENGELKVALKEAEAKACLRPPRSCLMRISPSISCRELELIRGDYKKEFPDAIVSEDDLKRVSNETDGVSEKPDSGGDAR